MPSDDAERPGGLERFAIDVALYAARCTELCIPTEPDYGYTDYFEAAATRNLALLGGFEELAEDADRRGILPSTDGEQATLVTDGGRDVDGTEHEMKLEAIELVKKEIELKNRSLVGKNRETLETKASEYVCSCGERFDIGRDARDHLLEQQGGETDA